MGVGIKGFGGSGSGSTKLQGFTALPPAAVAASGIFGAPPLELASFTTWSSTDRIAGNWILVDSDRGFQSPSNAAGIIRADDSQSTGKYYWEMFYTGGNGNAASFPDALAIGVARSDAPLSGAQGAPSAYFNSPSGFVLGSTEVMVALDLDNSAIWTGVDGTWDNGASQAEIEAGNTANATATGLSGAFFPFFIDGGTLESYHWNANFGQSAFSFTVPTGFLPGFGPLA